MTTHRLAFVLTAVAVAPVYRPVLAQVRAAVLANDIQDRWGVEVDVHPPGYEWRPPML